MTYQELFTRVNEVAAVLRDFCGLKAGDRVTIHMPMIPELPITMLACARLGVIHSVVFGGFSGEAAGLRAADSGSRVMIYADGYSRNGKIVDHKPSADIAVDAAQKEGHKVEKILVWRRYAGRNLSSKPMVPGRDYFMDEVLKDFKRAKVAPVSMDAEAPLFLMYTSGDGNPRVPAPTGGYLAYVTGTSKYYKHSPEDVYWCMADIGWITGHSYIVYGPLALAATSVIYEGVPTYPDPGRPWRIAEQLDVNIFHTSPTAIRMLRKTGPDEPKRYNYRFKHMTTVGEPIEPETWRWYYTSVGKSRAVIVDTWWQTETGGFLCSTIPALDAMKPAARPGRPRHYLSSTTNRGRKCRSVRTRGQICIRSVARNHADDLGRQDRFVQHIQQVLQRPHSQDWRDWTYFAADGALLTPDRYYRILGRVDDVINVAGHRLGTKELESACLTVKEVAEAAVVPVVDELKGRMPVVYVSLKPGVSDGKRVAAEIVTTLETMIGKIARPKAVHVVPDLPKTRSGKIMRRVLAAISNNMNTGDVTTLANPEIVEVIRLEVQGKDPVVLREGPEDVKRFGEAE